MQKQKILQQGAEALLIQKNPSILIKRRIKKSYRLPFLDKKLRTSRTKKEAKLLEKISSLIPVPKLIKVDNEKNEIEMQFIKGKKLSEHLDSIKDNLKICEQIGRQIAILHDNNIIHGDLTTSNMILSTSPKSSSSKNTATSTKDTSNLSNKIGFHDNNKLYFIDFGLSFHSSRDEDKAVDLHLIKQALEAKHFKNYEKFFQAVLKGYKSSKNSQQVFKRLEKVEKRGRYKQQF